MKTLAVITARGGSKRIPRKNIKDFLGKPIIHYSIEAALKSGVFDTVMVSTEDEEIAQVAKAAGAEVPFLRSKDTADDHSTTADVLLEVLTEYEARGIHFDALCCIYPTAPFVTAEKLKDAMGQFLQAGADTLIPVVPFSYPPQRAMVIENGSLVFKYPQYMDSRSQDLEKHYHDVGQFYLFRVERYKQLQKLMLGNILPYIVDEREVQDIDNQSDWDIAEMKYRIMREK